MSKGKILLVEDNHTIAKQTGDFLQGLGWSVDFADSGKQAQQLALAEVFDLIILDLGLPDIDGLTVCQTIKEQSQRNTPILMLTARDAFEDKAKGFATGADDYLTKPFDLRELALRCDALTRRNQLFQSQTLSIGELTINTTNKTVTRAQSTIEINSAAFSILHQLMLAYPNPVSKSVLIHTLWGDEPPETDALKSHIYNLRSKLDKPFAYPMISTITNLGYKLDIKHETD